MTRPANRRALLDELAAMRGTYVARVRRWPEAAGDEEEVVHDAFARAVAAAGALRDEARGEEWFFRVLRSAYLDHLRRSEARERLRADVAREIVVARQFQPDPPELGCACLLRALISLRREYRTALEIVELEGKTLAELASVAGITANNAGVRVHRARTALARAARACCHGCRASREGCVCGL